MWCFYLLDWIIGSSSLDIFKMLFVFYLAAKKVFSTARKFYSWIVYQHLKIFKCLSHSAIGWFIRRRDLVSLLLFWGFTDCWLTKWLFFHFLKFLAVAATSSAPSDQREDFNQKTTLLLCKHSMIYLPQWVGNNF